MHDDVGHWTVEETSARGISFLPRTVAKALNALETDATLMRALGPVIGPAFLRVKRSELEAYDLEVTEWVRTA